MNDINKIQSVLAKSGHDKFTVYLAQPVKDVGLYMVYPYCKSVVPRDVIPAIKEVLKESSGSFNGDSNASWMLFLSLSKAAKAYEDLIQWFETYEIKKNESTEVESTETELEEAA